MPFNLKIFDSLYRGALGSHEAFKVGYSECFILNFFNVVHDSASIVDSRIRDEIQRLHNISFSRALNQDDILFWLTSFALLSLSFTACMCCLNVRCWSNFKPKCYFLSIYSKIQMFFTLICSEENYFCFICVS